MELERETRENEQLKHKADGDRKHNAREISALETKL